MARPTKYKPEYAEQVRKLCDKYAATDAEVADFFGCSRSTLNVWKLQYPEFAQAMAEAKGPANDRVARSLYERAMGYSCVETDIRVVQGRIVKTEVVKHYPPDVVAMIFWLKNRESGKWSDKSEVDLNVKDNLAEKMAEARARILQAKGEQKATH